MTPTVHSFELIYRLAITFTIVVLLGCGNGSNSADNESTNQSATISFQIKLNQTSNHALNKPANHAIGEPDICNDYLIDKIGVQVYRTQDDTEVGSAEADCNDHSLTVSNVPAAETLHLVCKGYVGGNPVWQGRVADIVAVAGQNTDLGAIDMNYNGDDDTAPEVVSTFPAPDAANVDLNASIVVVFNEKLAPGSISDQAITVLHDDIPVSGQVGYNPAFNSIRFFPTNAFDAEKTYTVTLHSKNNDGGLITDTAGHPFSGDVSWKFTTRGTDDNTAPHVIATSPPSGATNVAPQATISVLFNERLNPDSISNSIMIVTSGQGNVIGSVTYNDADRSLSFTPDDPLSPSSQYTATITTDVQDLAGNKPPVPSSWQFSTQGTLNQLTITTNASSGGIINPAGDISVNYGADQTFQIMANDGYYLSELRVDGDLLSLSTATTSYTFLNVTQNHSIQVNFKAVKYVDAAAAGNGTTWENAFGSIQQAVDAADAGNEIWIKNGQYLLSDTITVDKQLSIYGGFNGDEIHLEQRTLIDGQNDTTIDGNQLIGCFRFFPEANNVRLNGVVILNGNSTQGGGVYCEAETTIENCKISACKANRGGGIITKNHLTLIDSQLNNNGANAGLGGGIYNQGRLTITNCEFNDNWVSEGSESFGGAIYSDGSQALKVINTIFFSNYAYFGAAVYNKDSSFSLFDLCEFNGANRYIYSGGGIYNINSNVTISKSLFKRNVGEGGCGVRVENNDQLLSCNIIDSKFLNNSAEFTGAGLHIENGSVNLKNSVFYKNISGDGGAIFVKDGWTDIINCTIINNASENGGLVAQVPIDVTNSILWYNDSTDGPMQVSGSVSVTYCNIDQAEHVGYRKNIGIEPALENPEQHNFHLQHDSPCINKGNNNDPNLPLYDFESDDRIIDGIVDIGADEYKM